MLIMWISRFVKLLMILNFEGRRFGNGFCNGFNGCLATDFVTDLTDIRDLIPNAQCPMPDAQFPIPNYLILYSIHLPCLSAISPGIFGCQSVRVRI